MIQTRLFIALGLAAIAHSAIALPKVAIVAAAGTTVTDARFTDPQSKLVGTGRFSQVDIIAANLSTPDLLALQQYDAVIVWSNVNFQNAANLSTSLASYVDAGGGVVLAVFANSTSTTGRFLTGRWQNGDLDIIPPAGGSTSGAASLGLTLEPGHPLMEGVNTLSATIASRPTSSAFRPGCRAIANWSDGKFLTAEHPKQQRCDIGLYPPSNLVSASWWNSAGDGDDLMANALTWASAYRGTATNIVVDLGLPFGGDINSINESDNSVFSVLSDENEPNATVTMTHTIPSGTYGAAYLRTEVGSTRTDLSVFTEVFNLTTNSWEGIATSTSTLSDSVQWVKLASSSDYIASGSGEIKSRFRWIPQQDLESSDGWSETIDQVRWVVHKG